MCAPVLFLLFKPDHAPLHGRSLLLPLPVLQEEGAPHSHEDAKIGDDGGAARKEELR